MAAECTPATPGEAAAHTPAAAHQRRNSSANPDTTQCLAQVLEEEVPLVAGVVASVERAPEYAERVAVVANC